MVAIGSTGSGKSTLLSALVDGPESLEWTKIEGQKKFVFQHKVANPVFKIGHSAAKSETFFPNAGPDPENEDIYYVDIAGQDDNRGDLIELINGFITRTIFRQAKSVRFLITMEISNLTALRGQKVS